MKKAEILTLLANKVEPQTIEDAILAGKLETAMQGAERDVRMARQFSEGADWKEVLRVMRGTMDKEINHRNERSPKIPHPVKKSRY